MRPAAVNNVVGNLFEAATREADAMRSLAERAKHWQPRESYFRLASIINELIVYARERDAALAAKVHECAVLRMRLEQRELSVKRKGA